MSRCSLLFGPFHVCREPGGTSCAPRTWPLSLPAKGALSQPLSSPGSQVPESTAISWRGRLQCAPPVWCTPEEVSLSGAMRPASLSLPPILPCSPKRRSHPSPAGRPSQFFFLGRPRGWALPVRKPVGSGSVPGRPSQVPKRRAELPPQPARVSAA